MFKNVVVGVDEGGRDAIAIITNLLDQNATLTLATCTTAIRMLGAGRGPHTMLPNATARASCSKRRASRPASKPSRAGVDPRLEAVGCRRSCGFLRGPLGGAPLAALVLVLGRQGSL